MVLGAAVAALAGGLCPTAQQHMSEEQPATCLLPVLLSISPDCLSCMTRLTAAAAVSGVGGSRNRHQRRLACRIDVAKELAAYANCRKLV